MTNLPILIPDQDFVLDAAVDRVASDFPVISEQAVLELEMNKPSLTEVGRVSIHSTLIQQPEPESNLEKPEPTPTDRLITDGAIRVIDEIIKPVQSFITNIVNSTSNFFKLGNDTVTASEQIISNGFTEILSNTEKVYTDSRETSLRQTAGLVENMTSAVKEITEKTVLERERSRETLNHLTALVKSAELNTTEILNKEAANSSNEESSANFILLESDSPILNIFKERDSELAAPANINSSTSKTASSNISVKSNKLIDKYEIKNIMTPDKTLEKSVTMLSQALPEAVNNLSASVTSINPNTVNSSTSFTEGARIDQSRSMTINQVQSQLGHNTMPENSTPNQDPQNQMTDYYLQAIYAALMSGKIKVKLETY